MPTAGPVIGLRPRRPEPRDPETKRGRCLSTGPLSWWRGWDLNPRPPGYEPDELPDCSTLRRADEISSRLATAYQAEAEGAVVVVDGVAACEAPARAWRTRSAA